jgi:hypothetical protein
MGLNYGQFGGAVQEYLGAKIAAHLSPLNLPKRADASKLANNDGHWKLR